jgi:hypothetical protein
MSLGSGRTDTARRDSLVGTAAWVAGRAVRRLLERAGFPNAVVMAFVTLVLLVVQPAGWVSMLAAAFAGKVVGALAGHCHSRDW